MEDRITPTIVFNPQFGTETVSNGHGEVGHDLPIYLIFNGDFWQSSPGGTNLMDQVEKAVKAVIGSTYLNGTSQYPLNVPGLSLPGHPFIAGITQDPNVLSDGFGFVGPNIGLTFHGPSFDWLPTGTLCGNVENIIDSGFLPDTDGTATRPLYLEVTGPTVHMHPGVVLPSIGPFPGLDLTGSRPSGMHAFYPDPDNSDPLMHFFSSK